MENHAARSFYEIEAVQNNWAACELDRQVNSFHYRVRKMKTKSNTTALSYSIMAGQNHDRISSRNMILAGHDSA